MNAGIPEADALLYAAMFTGHRMTAAMLTKVDRHLLRDIGINIVGHQLLILRHAELVCWDQMSDDTQNHQPQSGVKVKRVPHLISLLDPILEQESSQSAKKRKMSSPGIPLTPHSPDWPFTADPKGNHTSTTDIDGHAASTQKQPILTLRILILGLVLLYFMWYDSDYLFSRPSGFQTI